MINIKFIFKCMLDLNQAANPRFNLTDFSIDYDEIMSDNVSKLSSNSKYNDDDGRYPVGQQGNRLYCRKFSYCA